MGGSCDRQAKISIYNADEELPRAVREVIRARADMGTSTLLERQFYNRWFPLGVEGRSEVDIKALTEGREKWVRGEQ